MQDIETAIGETNSQTLLTPRRQVLVKVDRRLRDFLFGGQRGRRQNIAAQFRECDNRGPALADGDGGCCARCPQRGFPICARGKRNRERGDDSIPGARHVARDDTAASAADAPTDRGAHASARGDARAEQR